MFKVSIVIWAPANKYVITACALNDFLNYPFCLQNVKKQWKMAIIISQSQAAIRWQIVSVLVIMHNSISFWHVFLWQGTTNVDKNKQ